MLDRHIWNSQNPGSLLPAIPDFALQLFDALDVLCLGKDKIKINRQTEYFGPIYFRYGYSFFFIQMQSIWVRSITRLEHQIIWRFYLNAAHFAGLIAIISFSGMHLLCKSLLINSLLMPEQLLCQADF